jgi:monoamine oxidase
LIPNVDIVVIGAGAAGIGAARQLAQSRVSTRVLEAGPRPGGRACTQEIAGLSLDLGCGWMHSADRNGWVHIARDLHVEIDRSKAAWGAQFRNVDFSPDEQSEAWRAFDSWTRRLTDAPPPGDRASEALATGERWNAHIRAIAGFVSGAELERLSAADYAAYDEASSEDNWRLPGGFGSLIVRSYPRGIPLSLATPVHSLTLDKGGVRLGTAEGDLTARAAILTVSTAVLAGDTIKLPAELGPWRDAARRLPLGLNEKLFLEIHGEAPFEPETHVTGNPRDALTASYYIRPFGWPVIECYFGGGRAQLLCERGLAAGFEFAIDQLARLFGSDVRRALRPLIGSNWTRMPRIGGAYSYALPGQASAREQLAQPLDGRVFFAGEATMKGDYSTAHGAYDSGVRAAAEAIAALERK